MNIARAVAGAALAFLLTGCGTSAIAGQASPAADDSCRGSGCTATVAPSSVVAVDPASAASSPTIVASGPPRPITARDWAKIAKDPKTHVGDAIVVYGQVKQFDTATGTSSFRASVDGVQHRVSYGYADYETNTILSGDEGSFGDLVEGDLFRAEAVVAGTYTYDTTIGGEQTAPVLAVSAIKVTGSAK